MSTRDAEQLRQARTAPPLGILGMPDRLPFTVRRFPPAADLAWCVDRFWVSSWDLPGRSAVTRILPHPCVNLTIEEDGLRVTGVANGVWSRRLTGTGSAFGVKFQPGAFRLLTAVPIASLSGSGQSATGVLPNAGPLEQALTEAGDDAARTRVIEDFLRASGLGADPTLELIAAAVRMLIGDHEIRRVGQAGDRLGVSERTLQRMFVDYVGVTPGWVLRRGRLHAAAERVIQLAAGDPGDGLAGVAAEFGYADQAHFTRDFRRVLGVPPAGWAASLVREEPVPA